MKPRKAKPQRRGAAALLRLDRYALEKSLHLCARRFTAAKAKWEHLKCPFTVRPVQEKYLLQMLHLVAKV